MKLYALPILALIALPLVGGQQSNINRDPTPFRKYPTTQQNQSSILSNEERILLLEQDEISHEKADAILEEHMTHHMDDMLRGQGSQDGRINALESKMDTVYRFGGVFGVILTLSVPFFIWVLSKSASHSEKLSESMTRLVADVQSIKAVCGLHRTMTGDEDLEHSNT